MIDGERIGEERLLIPETPSGLQRRTNSKKALKNKNKKKKKLKKTTN
jgi:hypothetical protein